jgi:hypothetical protein
MNRRTHFYLKLFCIFGTILLFLLMYVWVTDVQAQETEPHHNRDIEVGLVVGHRPLFHDSIKHFPGVDKIAWTYAGYWQSTRPELADWEMIPYHDQGTYRNRRVNHCAPRMFVLHSPNMAYPHGYYASFDDAVQIVLDVAEQCPDAELLVGNASPHNYCLYGHNLPFCGTGAQWADRFLDTWERETKTLFPYTLSVILSENHSNDDYPIRLQAIDNMLVAQTHNVDRVVVSYFGSKHGGYTDTYNGLVLVESLGYDAVFVSSPRGHTYNRYYVKNGQVHWLSCHRALLCGVMNPKYTPAGLALLDFLDENR